jgi:hypothetical protein
MYLDAYYPFSPYTGFFVYDLTRRSRKLYHQEEFQRLSPAERSAVVRDALKGDETISRLYRGAILMAQVSYYGGIYDPDGRCPLIDLPGRNRGYAPATITHPDAEQYLAPETTDDGNPP